MKTKKALFITNVDEIDEHLWSGTGYHLYKALESEYIIDHFAAYINTRLFCFIIRMLRKFKLNLIASIIDLKIRTWKYNRKIKNSKFDIIFSLIVFVPKLKKQTKFYFFDDKTCSYLLKEVYPRKDFYVNSNFPFKKDELMFFEKIERKMFKKSAGIFLMGQYLLDFSKCYYNDVIYSKIHYTGGWVSNIKRLTSDEFNEKENAFLFVGLDAYRKGLDLVIEAFLNVLKGNIILPKLYIVGAEPDIKLSNSNIICLGRLNNDEVHYYFKKAKVFVMPSRFDCYGIVFGEALVNGCVVIGSNYLEMNNIINENNGYKVNPYSENILEELTYVMNKAITNTELQKKVFADNDYYISIYDKQGMLKKVLETIGNER